jgi:hypothetical protein
LETARVGVGWVALGLVAVFGLVGTQMCWSLRPFIVRPRAQVTFLRQVEGSFIDAVETSSSSALGIYQRNSAPLPGRSAGDANGSNDAEGEGR